MTARSCASSWSLHRDKARTEPGAASGAAPALGAENAEALVLRGQRLPPIERHEVERTRIVLRRRVSRAELQRIGSPQGMTRDESLGVAPDDLDRGDFRPAIPRGEELSSRALQPPGRTGF